MRDDIKKTVCFGADWTAAVNLNHPVARYPNNPILTPTAVNQVWTDPVHQVVTVHNAGVARLKDETVMLFRSHLRCGKSVLGVARSKNGVDEWVVDETIAMKPACDSDAFADDIDIQALIENEGGGVEDPRITAFEDGFAITYSAYHAQVKNRVRVSLAETQDFRTFVRYGPMLERDMRNVVVFPEKFGERHVALFRPNDVASGDVGGMYTSIRLGYSKDWRLNQWELEPYPFFQTGAGPSPFSDKIGPGAVPVKTSSGWLNVFHGVRATMDGNPYVLGVALHDLKDPSQVKVSSLPILFPSQADCRVAETDYVHVPNVVFSCGLVMSEDGSILLYYGGNDTVMNLGGSHVDVLVALCERYGQDPNTGALQYPL